MEADLDAHNVGQKKLMAKFIPGHIKGAALAILLREVGHALTRVMGFYRSLAGIQRSISTPRRRSLSANLAEEQPVQLTFFITQTE